MTVLDLHVGVRPVTGSLGYLRVLFERFDIYRRHIRAGLEIDALLALTDRQLAERGLSRENVGRTIMAKHGVALGLSPVTGLGSAHRDG